MRNWLILLITLNGAVFAYGMDWLMLTPPSEQDREPNRVLQQLQPESISIAFPVPAKRLAESPKNITPPNDRVVQTQLNTKCVEWGGFTPEEIPKALAWLSKNSPSQTITHRSTEEVSTWIVSPERLYTNLATARQTLKRIEKNYPKASIFLDEGTKQFRIALTRFNDVTQAQAFIMEHQPEGLGTLSAVTETSRQVWLGLPNIQTSMMTALENANKEFPNQRLQTCRPLTS